MESCTCFNYLVWWGIFQLIVLVLHLISNASDVGQDLHRLRMELAQLKQLHQQVHQQREVWECLDQQPMGPNRQPPQGKPATMDKVSTLLEIRVQQE